MSADNYRPCPKCRRKRDTELRGLALKVADATKADSLAHYLKASEELRAVERAGLEDTLREDYELGTYLTGKFEVSYKCSCSVKGCGFTHTYEFVKDLLPVKL